MLLLGMGSYPQAAAILTGTLGLPTWLAHLAFLHLLRLMPRTLVAGG